MIHGMDALSPNHLLAAWEAGTDRPPAERALAILAAASPGSHPDVLARLNIGERDRRLAAIRSRTFGPNLACRSACPNCADPLEWDLPSHALAGPEIPDAVSVRLNGLTATFRVPATEDLQSILPLPASEAPRALLQRCFHSATRVGSNHAPTHAPDLPEPGFEDLPQAMLAAAENALAEACPGSAPEFDLTCPSCGHQWSTRLDLPAFVWIEVDAAARSLLRDVHQIASAYGWPEQDILALSPSRRAAYLELIGG